ncbi:unnamed protein product [Ixodes hexagonus]
MPISDDAVVSYRQKYRNLKRKLKFLLYENECFQEELRKAQRKLLKVTRDKSFLLDQILQYESIDSSSSDSDATVSSDSEPEHRIEPLPPVIKKKKPAVSNDVPLLHHVPVATAAASSATAAASVAPCVASCSIPIKTEMPTVAAVAAGSSSGSAASIGILPAISANPKSAIPVATPVALNPTLEKKKKVARTPKPIAHAQPSPLQLQPQLQPQPQPPQLQQQTQPAQPQPQPPQQQPLQQQTTTLQQPQQQPQQPQPSQKLLQAQQLTTSKPLLTTSSIQKRIMEASETLTVGRLDGHMTSEEVERHLEARQALRDLLPEKAPLTVPAELFSNEPPGDLLDGGMLGNASERVLAVCVPEGTSVVDDEGLVIDLPE